MFHAYAQLMQFTTGLPQGATIVIMPKFELTTLCHAIDKYKVQYAILQIYKDCLSCDQTRIGVVG